MKEALPYGSWPSPITPELVASEGIRFSEVTFDGDELLWLERRPHEGGRTVVVGRDAGGAVGDRIPSGMNVRTLAHEYGGGAYLAHRGRLFFVNFDDQDVYVITSRLEPPRRLTDQLEVRFADLFFDDHRGRLLAVAEDHQAAGEPTNRLVAIDSSSGEVVTLVEGADFYSNPISNEAGDRLAWLSWAHPDMPWDAARLETAEVDDEGRVGPARFVAGGDGESIFQPRWSAAGSLTFMSDRSGWWNLYLWDGDDMRPVLQRSEDMGLPQWVFGMSTWDFVDGESVAIAMSDSGRWHLVEVTNGRAQEIDLPFTVLDSVCCSAARVAFIGASGVLAPAVVVAARDGSGFEVVRSSSSLEIDSEYLSQPQFVEFPCEGDSKGHAIYYPPRSGVAQGPSDEKPMLLVLSHGGPTAAASSALNLGVQYWTSRGFAVVDVDYRGSTGYGRRYRDALRGRWGIADVDDCVSAARHLIQRGEVDGARLAIRGGSAGGYTTLAALTFRDVFSAGASYYGIGDLETLARDTHKFESRYLDRLVGPYPEERATYQERSPLNFTERLSCPTIFFQGLEDRIVPPNQAEAMVAALERRGVPVAYVPFAGEQHGFRRAENIARALEAELYFYSRVFGFVPGDSPEPVEILNEQALPAV